MTIPAATAIAVPTNKRYTAPALDAASGVSFARKITPAAVADGGPAEVLQKAVACLKLNEGKSTAINWSKAIPAGGTETVEQLQRHIKIPEIEIKSYRRTLEIAQHVPGKAEPEITKIKIPSRADFGPDVDVPDKVGPLELKLVGDRWQLKLAHTTPKDAPEENKALVFAQETEAAFAKANSILAINHQKLQSPDAKGYLDAERPSTGLAVKEVVGDDAKKAAQKLDVEREVVKSLLNVDQAITKFQRDLLVKLAPDQAERRFNSIRLAVVAGATTTLRRKIRALFERNALLNANKTAVTDMAQLEDVMAGLRAFTPGITDEEVRPVSSSVLPHTLIAVDAHDKAMRARNKALNATSSLEVKQEEVAKAAAAVVKANEATATATAAALTVSEDLRVSAGKLVATAAAATAAAATAAAEAAAAEAAAAEAAAAVAPAPEGVAPAPEGVAGGRSVFRRAMGGVGSVAAAPMRGLSGIIGRVRGNP
jgi:hypothetical protein